MIRALALAFALLPGSGPARAEPAPATVPPVIKLMREEIQARPSRVLIAVEDALTMEERAACEIVKEAITATRADAKLTGEIVRTALKHAPAMAATIVECAVAVAPGAVEEIEKAVRSVLGDNAGTASKTSAPEESDTGKKEASGKSAPGAAAAPAEDGADSVDSFLPGAVGVGGIYLIAPSRAFRPCLPGDFCCSGDLSVSCLSPR